MTYNRGSAVISLEGGRVPTALCEIVLFSTSDGPGGRYYLSLLLLLFLLYTSSPPFDSLTSLVSLFSFCLPRSFSFLEPPPRRDTFHLNIAVTSSLPEHLSIYLSIGAKCHLLLVKVVNSWCSATVTCCVKLTDGGATGRSGTCYHYDGPNTTE